MKHLLDLAINELQNSEFKYSLTTTGGKEEFINTSKDVKFHRLERVRGVSHYVENYTSTKGWQSLKFDDSFNFLTNQEAKMYLDIVSSLDCPHFAILHKEFKNALLSGLRQTISATRPESEVQKEYIKELKKEIERLKEVIDEKNKKITSLFSIQHIETQNGNFLININNQLMYYIDKTGKVLRDCTPVFNEEDQKSEWDWAIENWNNGPVNGFPTLEEDTKTDTSKFTKAYILINY